MRVIAVLPVLGALFPHSNSWRLKFLDFLFAVLPIVALCIVGEPWICCLIFLVIGKWLYWRPKMKSLDDVVLDNALHIGRGLPLFGTCMVILAVDFRAFPRILAKTENFGYAFMDAGVGCFVFANGLFSPWARNLPSFQRESSVEDFPQLLERTRRVLKSCSRFLLLGLLRVLAVKSTNYQEHQTEYGVHGNFFFVLAGLRLFSGVFDPMLNRWQVSPEFLSWVLIAVQELGLKLGLENWVLEAPLNRAELGFVSQNREIFVSFLGYAALYYAGVNFGKWVRNRQRRYRNSLTFGEKFVALHLASNVIFGYFMPSRRLMNSAYFFWMVLANTIHYRICLLIEEIFYNRVCKIISVQIVSQKTAIQTACSIISGSSSPFLRKFSRNGMFVFLVANLFTGLVNLSFNTLSVGGVMTAVILFCHAALLGISSEVFEYWMPGKGHHIPSLVTSDEKGGNGDGLKKRPEEPNSFPREDDSELTKMNVEQFQSYFQDSDSDA
ncbi:unnamed protein product [Notodromas monacha]|uniref:Phosphatidylinositol-glycan biosynthesis class W protein n=1 Tax=Notodromas monacha TaxID=399045 RepID=A0A7R9C3K6_9CRUS|nr:unnamed protein product [Notodromas monacha]CAG0925159.1 unnamed protein product [Notodromas monacha]